MKEYPLINLPGLHNIEAELGETIVSPNGITYSIGGKPHSKGGTKMLAEPGSVIMSRHLKLPGEVATKLGGMDRATSPADLSRKYRTDKYSEMMADVTGRYDSLSIKTAALMFDKNAAMQGLIFNAQESLKESKGMKNDMSYAQIGASVTQPSLFKFAVSNQDGTPFKPFNVDGDRSPGFSRIDNGVFQTVSYPLATDPYYGDVQAKSLSGAKLNRAEKKILGDHQLRLSNLRQTFGQKDGALLEKDYARYIRSAEGIEQDKGLEHYLKMSDGTQVLIKNATDAQIDSSVGLRHYNNRTGKDDIVDFNDRQNQGWYPKIVSEGKPQDFSIQPLPSRERAILNLPAISGAPPTTTITPAGTRKPPPGGIDSQSIMNGVQIGLAALDLATTRVKPPYYDYRPSEIAYTRFEPLNTKQQERAFNIARESIENSNIPSQVKQAQLANMYGSMIEGTNQIDLANQQGKLNNDNRNVEMFRGMRNQDILREQDSNLQYVQEADRRNSQKNEQRQEYLNSILGVWRDHTSNRRDIGLLDQSSQNYDYNFNNEQIQYTPGGGFRSRPTNLTAFRTAQNLPEGITPGDLTAEARRRLGI